MSNYTEKLAQLAVNYAVSVKKGDKVFIQGHGVAQDLLVDVYTAVLKKGGYPIIQVQLPGTVEALYEFGSDEQLQHVSPLMKVVIDQYEKYISVMADHNTRKLQTVNAEKIKIANMTEEKAQLNARFEERVAKGELEWTLLPYPCESFAQEAGMGLNYYTKFVEQALMLNYPDPIAQWKTIEVKQAKVVEYLNKVDQIHVVGEDTDLTLSVKGRTWENCCGHKNLPDGEIFTGPIEDSINGHIRFTFPGIYQGKEIENIFLEFEAGKVVKGTASKGEDLLHAILGIPNADHIGEFAIGTNYGITQFTKNMLFDEKMGGTLHMALGLGFAETGSKARSAIHWDILKDMKKPGSNITADGKIIYAEGQWKI